MNSRRYAKHYALPERIGTPDLFVGREKEMAYLHQWVERIPWQRSKSKVILARKKSGKTAIVQRLFNQLWSAGDGGKDNPWESKIIPFYYEIKDLRIWFPNFALKYYQTFASQYISYLERDPTLVHNLLSLEQVQTYGEQKGIEVLVQDTKQLLEANKKEDGDLMWSTAYTAPHRYASLFDCRIVVILDEFQNISNHIYRDEGCKLSCDETMAGSFHEHVESKIAPMLVTGSYVGWLTQVIDQYLEAGRLKRWKFPPYLTEDEGLEVVYKYANSIQEPLTAPAAVSINKLCLSDPFFISCVIESDFEGRDLTTENGVIDTVHYELSNRDSEMATNWSEYINHSVDRINDLHAKNMLLHLCKYPDREWTHLELKDELKLDLPPQAILKRLSELAKADLIDEGISDIAFRGLKDGTLYLILRNRFEHEIRSVSIDLRDDFREKYAALKKENHSLRGKLNHLSGKMAEELFATELRTRKRFPISTYFVGVKAIGTVEVDQDANLNLIDVRSRYHIQRPDNKNMEIDVKAESEDNRTLLVEIKKRTQPTRLGMVQDFWEKVEVYVTLFPNQSILPAFLSLGGFDAKALEYCQTQGIGTATEIAYCQTEW